MFFQTHVKTIKEALRVPLAISKTSTIPILNTVRITATSKHVEFAATNIDSYITAVCCQGVEGVEGGVAFVNARQLKRALDSLSGEVVVESVDGRLIVGGVEICTEPGYELPANHTGLNRPTTLEPAVISGKELKSFINSVSRSIYRENAWRPGMQGILLRYSDLGVIQAVTTDGHRLSMDAISGDARTLEMHRECSPSLTEGIIINKDLVKVVQKIRAKETVDFLAHTCGVALSWEGKYGVTYSVDIAALEERFPKFEQVLPEDGEEKIAVQVLLEEILPFSELLSRERKSLVTLTVDPHANSLQLTGFLDNKTNKPYIQKTIKIIEARAKGRGVDGITLNAKYLRDALKSFDGDSVEIRWKKSEYPVTIRDNERCRLQVIMPFQLPKKP